MVQRIRFTFFLILLAGAVVLTRLFFLQVVSGAYYRTQASRQQNFSQILSPRRGEIYLRERSGELIPLASTKEGYALFINPKELVHPQEAWQKLSEVAKLDEEEFFKRASKKDDPYEVVAHKLERSDAQKIEALQIQGAGLVPEEWRVYPAKTLAAHAVGFLGYDGDELEGRYGLERYFEDVLKGNSGFINGSRSAGGILLDLGKRFFSPPEEGHDIILTLEPNVQTFLEKKLGEVQEAWQPARGGTIILEPATGKIQALAAFPAFD
ncbi:MAG: hypothetical protein AAB730_00165, partial [Patescibacteria group bacterium]